MDVDDYTQPLESVVRQERMAVYPVPLKLKDRQELFERWCKLNPQALRQIELTALAIDQRGLRVSTKYLIEKQRYEGTCKLVILFMIPAQNYTFFSYNLSYDSEIIRRNIVCIRFYF